MNFNIYVAYFEGLAYITSILWQNSGKFNEKIQAVLFCIIQLHFGKRISTKNSFTEYRTRRNHSENSIMYWVHLMHNLKHYWFIMSRGNVNVVIPKRTIDTILQSLFARKIRRKEVGQVRNVFNDVNHKCSNVVVSGWSKVPYSIYNLQVISSSIVESQIL